MPHREPFLFLQDVTIEGDQARGDYRITGNEYFQGHLGSTAFPASIMIEALGQMCVFFYFRGLIQG